MVRKKEWMPERCFGAGKGGKIKRFARTPSPLLEIRGNPKAFPANNAALRDRKNFCRKGEQLGSLSSYPPNAITR
jgi:hypothetical protein